MRTSIAVCLVLLVGLLLVPLYAQDEQMQAWMKASQPGQNHKYLEPMAGTWDVTTRMWAAPGAQPSESKATSEHKLMFDGRFLHQTFKGTFMNMPFEGLGLWGYDNMKKMYVSSWIDNSSTTIMTTWGSADDSGKVFTFNGEYTEPSGKTQKMKEIIRVEGPDKHVMEMYTPGPDGKEFKSMELVYTRK